MGLNYYVGQAIQKLGYSVIRVDRIPQSTLNLSLLAVKALFINTDRQRKLTIVQLGAYDGRFEDALQPILRSSIDYQAILVEPQPKPFSDATETYVSDQRVRVVNAAITESDGVISLYTNAEGHTPFASLLESRKKFIRNHTTIYVRGITFATLLQETNVVDIDFLMIDTEGFDFLILQQALQALKQRPKLIQLESYHLSPLERADMKKLLIKHDYVYSDIGHDTIALQSSLLQIAS